MSFLDKIGFKKLTEMRFPGRSFVFFNSPRAVDSELQRDVGDGTSANVVMSPIRWLQHALIESPLIVEQNKVKIDKHELIELLNRPNGFYSGEQLLSATVLSLSTDGNAYWLIVRNNANKPIQLWYAPHALITPTFPDDGSLFLSGYTYTVGGKKIKLEVRDVVHFRDGIDPDNLRKGVGPMKSLMREIWTDQEAAAMVAALMKNGGIPGIVISPDTTEPIDSDDAEATKEYMSQNFTRENRGKPLVMRGKTKVEQFGFSPAEMDLSAIRNVSEERVCAALGVRPAIVGFGTGIEQSAVGATMKEERRLSWENGVIPLQRIIVSEIQHKLMPSFRAGEVRFDNSEIAALQEDKNEKNKRIIDLVNGGLWTRAEGRLETGQDALPSDDVFLQGIAIIEVPRTGQVALPPPEKSLKELKVAENAPQVTPSPRILALANQLDKQLPGLNDSMQRDLIAFFEQLGDRAEQAALPVLKNLIDTAQILDGMTTELPVFQKLFERHFINVGELANVAIAKGLGVEVGIPDTVARSIIAAGGRRAGLIDLTEQAKQSIFNGLTEGRAAGLAGEGLARSIRETVVKGPWSTVEIRARVIARTETRFAQSISSIEMANGMGLERAIVLDNRIGFDDPEHIAMNGKIVSLDEARELTASEHPNGTRSFVGLTPALLEEMGE